MKYAIAALLLLSSWTVGPEFVASAGISNKRVATWVSYDAERGFDAIAPYADMIGSISLTNDASPDFIARCHQLGIEVYRLAGGDASAFDTPEHAQATIERYLKECREKNYDGIDLDFEKLDPSLRGKYSDFLRKASEALHRAGKKLSHCVDYPPGIEDRPPTLTFDDPVVIGETCDRVRLMAYDMFFAPLRCTNPSIIELGPTSSYPWTKAALAYWLKNVPREKLILGLPAYSNDYIMAGCPQGTGKQVYASKPELEPGFTSQKNWLAFEKVHIYAYRDSKRMAHLFFASDADSTRVLLEAADAAGVETVGFWRSDSVDAATWQVVRDWAGSKY